MREQLYKAKRVDNGEWVEGDLHRVFTDNVGKKGKLTWAIRILETYEDGSQGLRSIKVIPETVCQFTGLTDKNGVKIFEGDIIQTFKLASDGSKTENTRRVVDFKGASFVSWLMMFPDDKNWWTAQLDPQWIKKYEFEVTGNIHDK